MLEKLFKLIGLWALTTTLFASDQDLLMNLQKRLVDLPEGRGQLIQSYPENSQSYIYDQALAIITFSKARDQKHARSMMKAMEKLQNEDGSLYFSYHLNGISPYPEDGDKRFHGAVAWMALAAVHYQKAFSSKEFVPFNQKVLAYLESHMKPVTIKGKTSLALTFNASDISTTKWNEAETAALEHNLDAYAAFRHFHKLNPGSPWTKHVGDLRQFILALWDSNQEHFWSGANIKTGDINRDEYYLDNQSWSLLALDRETLKKINHEEALSLNCESLFVEHRGVKGFMDSKPARRPASTEFVWSEGSLGHLMAMDKQTEIRSKQILCQDKSSKELLQEVKKMKKPDGGIAYSTAVNNPDFSDQSSVAGTAWMYFASNKINPFDL